MHAYTHNYTYLSAAKKRLATAKAKTGDTSGKKAKVSAASSPASNKLPRIESSAAKQTTVPVPPPTPAPPTLPSPPPTTQLPPSPPRNPTPQNDDLLLFDVSDFNHDDIQVAVPKQGVLGGHAAKRAKIVDNQFEAIKERIASLEKNVTRRIDRLQGTVSFMAKCVEEFNENYTTIMDVVRDNRVREVSDDIASDVNFPFTSTRHVNEYIERDPKMVKLIDR